MKLRVIACALIGASLAVTASAKKPVNPEFQQIKREMAQLRATDLAAAAITDTGDADSFGRNVKFIGLMSTGNIILADDCTPDPAYPLGPDDHCFVANAAPATTSFTVTDAARILIPARSSNSLFCHWQTPIAYYHFSNPTGSFQPNGRIVVTPSYTFQNEVLNDPTLINLTTGLPFGGSMTVNLSGIRHDIGLQPGQNHMERDSTTRSCIAGLVSKRALMGAGLTATQASNFFKKDTVVTMNLQGTAVLVDYANIIVGTRFVGD